MVEALIALADDLLAHLEREEGIGPALRGWTAPAVAASLVCAMAILAQLSDPHVRLPPEDEGSGEALDAAVRAVLALDPLPDAVIVTGDLADGALPAEYDRVRELLEPASDARPRPARQPRRPRSSRPATSCGSASCG